MTMPALDNRTDFIVEPQLLVDRDGEKLCTMVKATFELWPEGRAHRLELAPEERRRGLRGADVPWGDPAVSSHAYPSDYCVSKPGTDVVVVAKAYAPHAEPVAQFDVGVRAGSLSKVVRVHGPRVWEQNGESISDAKPIRELAMRYDFAWGGTDDSDPDELLEEPTNPVGRGVARDASTLTHQPAPQLDDPTAPIRFARARNVASSLGPIGRHWVPRRGRWGTYDAAWLEQRAPLLPPDFDDRANQCASPGLSSNEPFRGDEVVALTHLTPEGGVVELRVPLVGLEIDVRVPGRNAATLRPHLDTLLIDTLLLVPGGPALTLELVWRASVVAPRKLKDARIRVTER